MIEGQRLKEESGSVVTRNTLANLLGNVLPLIVGLLAIPYTVRGLGNDRFGILTIAWAILGYFGLFDLGLGRATTKYVAEYLSRDEIDRLPKLIWTSIVSQLLLALAGTLLALAVLPLLVDRALRLPVVLIPETKTAFIILAASLPVVTLSNVLRGILEATQRFDLVNYVKVPATVSVFLLPVVAIWLGMRLPGIIFLLVLSRFMVIVAYWVLCLRELPVLRTAYAADSATLGRLFSYGGWIAISSVLVPFLTNADRFLIGSLLSMSAVTYYAAPFEALNRLLIIPASLSAVLFPTFSGLDAADKGRTELSELYARSVKSLLLVITPAVILLYVLAPTILRLWLGTEFETHSTSVLRILSVGMLINSLAYIPYSLLQAIGRPDLTAKFHLLQLPLYAVLMWFLIRTIGVSGAALAWTIRAAIDALCLFAASCWVGRVPFAAFGDRGLVRAFFGCCGFGLALLLVSFVGSASLQFGISGLLAVIFGIYTWVFVLEARDRNVLSSSLFRFVGGTRGN